MKILHLMLANFYADGFGYQENLLSRQNAKDGHEVKIIASTQSISEAGGIIYVNPSSYINEDGIEVTRIPYRNILPHYVMTKVRSYVGLYEEIVKFRPDVILHHGESSFDLLTVARYKANYPHVRLYVDSHAMFHNSARKILSREILHRRFYAPVLRRVLPYIEKILCVTTESMDFLETLYKIPRDKMELYPLGGVVFEEKERLNNRRIIRQGLDLTDDDILMIHSGKMNEKKRTVDLIKAFSNVDGTNARLLLIGSLSDDVRCLIEPVLKTDHRVQFLGWKDRDELLKHLCAADLYVQPGTQSATMQQALCCGAAAMLYPYKSHKDLLGETVFYAASVDDMETILNKILIDPMILETKRRQSFKLAKEKLDYRVLASRLYS